MLRFVLDEDVQLSLAQILRDLGESLSATFREV